jgi:hypothetical protein
MGESLLDDRGLLIDPRPPWLGYDAHVARQRGFKARRPAAPRHMSALALTFILGAAFGGGIAVWLCGRSRCAASEHE